MLHFHCFSDCGVIIYTVISYNVISWHFIFRWSIRSFFNRGLIPRALTRFLIVIKGFASCLVDWWWPASKKLLRRRNNLLGGRRFNGFRPLTIHYICLTHITIKLSNLCFIRIHLFNWSFVYRCSIANVNLWLLPWTSAVFVVIKLFSARLIYWRKPTWRELVITRSYV